MGSGWTRTPGPNWRDANRPAEPESRRARWIAGELGIPQDQLPPHWRSRWRDAGLPLHTETIAGQSRRLERALTVAVHRALIRPLRIATVLDRLSRLIDAIEARARR